MKQYKNSKGSLVTEQQLHIMDAYSIETMDDNTGKARLIEHYRGIENNSFKFFEYFLNPSENKGVIIQNYKNEPLFLGITVYLNKQVAFEFEMWEWENYSKNGELIGKGKKVFDEKRRVISQYNVDTQSDEILYDPTPKKYYYGSSNEPDNLKLDFKYELDSQTNHIKIFVDDDNETSGVIHTMKQDSFIAVFGQNFWDSHPYYHSILPLLPTSSSI